MENNLSNKAKFFALYWGQEILSDGNELGGVCGDFEDNLFLLLKPLTSITDEDAIEVCKIRWQNLKKEHPYTKGDISEGIRICREIKNTSANAFIGLQMFDYLRSKGYALPWMGLSVEKLAEYGWIKLV